MLQMPPHWPTPNAANRCDNKASSSLHKPGQIFEQTVALHQRDVQARLPTEESVIRNLRQRRAGDEGADARHPYVPPMYPPAVWDLVGHHHPSIWKVIQWFQKEDATIQAMLEQDRIGQAPKKCTKQLSLVCVQIRLQTPCRVYDNA